MDEVGAGPGESRPGDESGKPVSRPWPDNVIMSVAYVGLAAIALRGLYCFWNPPPVNYLVFFVFPFFCQWLYGVFATKTMRGRCCLLLYGVFSIWISFHALADVHRSRCGNSLGGALLFVTLPSMAMLLLGLLRIMQNRWKAQKVVVEE